MSSLRKIMLVATLFVVIVAYAVESPSKKMVNDDVLALLSAGVDPDIVVSKVLQAPLVAFDVSTDELIRLSRLKTPKKVIDAMLQRMNTNSPVRGVTSLPATAQATTTPELIGANSSVSLEGREGTHSSTFLYFGTLNWLNIDEPAASVRTVDPSPRIRVHLNTNPSKALRLVRLERNRKDRSLKLHSYNAMSFRIEIEKMLDVDEDWVISTSVSETSPGVWDVQPTKPLKKGEYALLEGQTMYDFGVDTPNR